MKKVLIITYYWPPSGGPGVQRWLKFVKYLPEFGIEPVVYIPENPNYPIMDESLLKEVPKGLKILKRPIFEPYKFAKFISKNQTNQMSRGIILKPKNQGLIEKLMLFIRGNCFIPDARRNWIKPSVKYLKSQVQADNIQTIITTGPPHSMHLIGLYLKKQMGIKWIADFRDPWTRIGYHKRLKLTQRSQAKHKELEWEVLQNADEVITTSFTTSQEFQNIVNKDIRVITNGYDNQVIMDVDMDKMFTISHIGSLLSERNPLMLWKALNELILENEAFKAAFKLNLIGVVSEVVLNSIYKHDLKDYVNVMGYVSHELALKYQKQSQVLLLIEIDSDETKCIIPGKLFECMVSERPILAIGPEGSDVEAIIKETNTGQYLYYNDKESIKSLLLEYFTAFQKGTLKVHPIGLQKYHRRELTKQLSALI